MSESPHPALQFAGPLKDEERGQHLRGHQLGRVANKPFGVSEWIHVYPSLYSAEGPVLVAAYGMGRQGWDASYEFNSTSKRLDAASALVGNLPWGVWNADVPTQLGQYPILSRMVLRGDVTTAPTISTRRVSSENLANGEFKFSDTVRQQGDIKSFTGSVPAESLAAGRAVVEFVDKTAPQHLPGHGPVQARHRDHLRDRPAQMGYCR